MHNVLSIVELLENIFTFVDAKSNANNACVCKQWSEICLASLWRDVTNLSGLLRILSPLQDIGVSYEFKKNLKRKDWKRFETYCQFVRRISFSGDDSFPCRNLLDIIGKNRLKLNLFPNLHTLELQDPTTQDCLTRHSVMFMHENVRCFIVSIPYGTIDYLSSYVDDVIGRMPMLTRLELLSDLSICEMEDEILALIRGLSNLHVIFLPPCHLTSRITEGLSHLPNLAEINYRGEPVKSEDDSEDDTEDDTETLFEPSLKEGAFPSLRHLALVVEFSSMAQFMNSPFFPSNLAILQIESYSWEEASAVHELSVAIAKNCRLLTKLYLSPNLDPFDGPEGERVTMDTLRPLLLSCPKITTFEIAHQHPLALELNDIEEITSKWPSIETLKLNHHPQAKTDVNHESLLTLRSLLPFAQHCPQLQHLALFLRASTADIPAAHELQSFQILKCLSMGYSHLADEDPVALFLSRICPVGCRVESSADLEGETGKLLRRKWETVDRLLPVLITLRMEERETSMERVKVLEAELEALRSELGRHGSMAMQ